MLTVEAHADAGRGHVALGLAARVRSEMEDGCSEHGARVPFLHASLEHIVSNTVPLFVLLLLLAGSQAKSSGVVVGIILLGGALLWLFGRPAIHIGASGLIFGLMAFLIVSGLRERRFVPLAISVLVTFLYGGSLLLGVVPQFGSNVSWDGHLCGALAGAAIAMALTRKPPRPAID